MSNQGLFSTLLTYIVGGALGDEYLFLVFFWKCRIRGRFRHFSLILLGLRWVMDIF